MSARVCHSVDADVDLDLAIALGLKLTAECGDVFIPTAQGSEADRFPPCTTCHPSAVRKDGRQRGQHRHPTEVIRALPHYVYRCYDADDRLLYVGCTYNPPARLRQHRGERKAWALEVARTRLTVWPSRRKALDMERLAIETEHPLYNRQFSKRESA